MSYDMCVMPWLTDKTGKINKLMPKANIVLIVMRSVTKYYLMQKNYLQM